MVYLEMDRDTMSGDDAQRGEGSTSFPSCLPSFRSLPRVPLSHGTAFTCGAGGGDGLRALSLTRSVFLHPSSFGSNKFYSVRN